MNRSAGPSCLVGTFVGRAHAISALLLATMGRSNAQAPERFTAWTRPVLGQLVAMRSDVVITEIAPNGFAEGSPLEAQWHHQTRGGTFPERIGAK